MMAVEIRHGGETVIAESDRGAVEAESPSYSIDARRVGETVEVNPGEWLVEAMPLSYSVGVDTGVLIGGIPYTGAYEAQARFTEQVFPTAMKTMQDDFSVHAINYTEAPNEYGTTLTIGG